jgi:hypothetical protein
MGRRGIAIQVTIAIEHPIWGRRTFAWPPRVRRRDVHAGFEGLPGRISVFQGSTLVGRREVTVMLFFGQARPTARQIRRANSELRRSRLD